MVKERGRQQPPLWPYLKKNIVFYWRSGPTQSTTRRQHTRVPNPQDKYVQSSGYGNVYTSCVTLGSFCLVNHKINECSSCVFCCIWWCLETNVHFFFFHSLRANKLSPTTSLSLASIASFESHSLCVKCGFQKSFVRIRLGGHFNWHLHGQ